MNGSNSPLSLRKLAFLISVGLIPATNSQNSSLSQEDLESVRGLFGLRSRRTSCDEIPTAKSLSEEAAKSLNDEIDYTDNKRRKFY